jgi:hypothetical protein
MISDFFSFIQSTLKQKDLKNSFLFHLIRVINFWFSLMTSLLFLHQTFTFWYLNQSLKLKLYISGISALSLSSFSRTLKKSLKLQDPFSFLITTLTTTLDFFDSNPDLSFLWLVLINLSTPYFISNSTNF